MIIRINIFYAHIYAEYIENPKVCMYDAVVVVSQRSNIQSLFIYDLNVKRSLSGSMNII